MICCEDRGQNGIAFLEQNLGCRHLLQAESELLNMLIELLQSFLLCLPLLQLHKQISVGERRDAVRAGCTFRKP